MRTPIMIDHFVFTVHTSKFDSVVAWYLAALAPLKYTTQHSFPQAVGLGPSPTEASFWIGASDEPGASGFHLAFKASRREDVDRFHEEAIQAGGKDNGKPGLREEYGPNYYGAFVFDPLGLVFLYVRTIQLWMIRMDCWRQICENVEC